MKTLTIVLILGFVAYVIWKWLFKMSGKRFKELYGPWAVVLGSSEGLGKELARSIAKRGLNIVLVARTASKLQLSAREIEAEFSVQTRIIAGDLSTKESINSIFNSCSDLDIGMVVHNAAGANTGPFEKFTLEDKLNVVNVNALGVTVCCDLFGKKLLERFRTTKKRSGMLLVSSLVGITGSANVAVYSATKSFIISLANALWSEWKPQGVDVRSVLFGAVTTPNLVNSNLGKNSQNIPGIQRPEDAAERALDAFNHYDPRCLPHWDAQIVAFLCEMILPHSLGVLLVSAGSSIGV